MANYLEDLSLGLRQAAGVLNPDVQKQTFAADAQKEQLLRQFQLQQATPQALLASTQVQEHLIKLRKEKLTQEYLNSPEVKTLSEKAQEGDEGAFNKILGGLAARGLIDPIAYAKEQIAARQPKPIGAGGALIPDGKGGYTRMSPDAKPMVEHNYSVSQDMVQPHISFDNGKTWTPVPGSTPSHKFAGQAVDNTKYANVQPDGKGGFIGLSKKTGQMEQIPLAPGVEGSPQLTGDALEAAATRYRIDGTLPTNLGRGTQGYANTTKILNRASQLAAEAGDSAEEQRIKQIVARTATVALQGVTKDLAALRPYKEMLDQNANIAIDLGQKIAKDKTSSAFVNKPLLWLKNNASDRPDIAEYLAQMHFVEVEAARVLSNPRLVGQLTDTAIADMKSVVSGNMTLASSERVLRRMMSDGDNRVNTMIKEKNSLLKDISGKSRPSGATAGGASVSNW